MMGLHDRDPNGVPQPDDRHMGPIILKMLVESIYSSHSWENRNEEGMTSDIFSSKEG
jgi:hypothetical protein